MMYDACPWHEYWVPDDLHGDMVDMVVMIDIVEMVDMVEMA